MDKKQNIKEEVEKTISLLDNVEEIDVNPFLFTKIKAQLDSGVAESGKKSFDWIFKVLRPAMAAALLLVNIYSVIAFYQSSYANEETRQQYLESIANEYAIDSNFDYLKTSDKKD
jgi:hypothetical protein